MDSDIANDALDGGHRDTLALRLLNCTLWHLHAEPPRPVEAAKVLNEVVGNCTNVRTMATVAAYVSSEPLASGGPKGAPPVRTQGLQPRTSAVL